MHPEARSGCMAGAGCGAVLTRVQSTWDICAMQKGVTAWDVGLTPATAAQGRAAEQAGPSECLEEQHFLPTVVSG